MKDICGTCIRSQVVEPPHGVEYYTCQRNLSKVCGYYDMPCEHYEPDLEYIAFMGFDTEEE